MESGSSRSRVDKLGVKPASRVAVIGVDDVGLPDELQASGARVLAVGGEADIPTGIDLVLLAADHPNELARLPALRARLAPAGAIWVVSRKGTARTLLEVEIMAAARSAGLVDNKVVAFSETHTAMRLVVPLALRS